MIPHSAGFIVIFSLTVSSSLHAAFLTGDGEDQAWKQIRPVKDHKDNADSLLWSRRTSRPNMDTTILPMTTPPKTQNSGSVVHGDTGESSLTNLLATLGSFPYPVSQVQSKVFKALEYTTSPDQRRPEIRLSNTRVLGESKAAAQRSDDTSLKQKQIDLITTLQDNRRIMEEFTTRPPYHSNSLTGKTLIYRMLFSKSICNMIQVC